MNMIYVWIYTRSEFIEQLSASAFKHSFDKIFYCSADERSQPCNTGISTVLFDLMKSRKMIIVREIFKIKISYIDLKYGFNCLRWCKRETMPSE